MVVKVKAQKGFTLIETLIASSILMLILYAGYFGYAQFSERWDKRVDFYWQQTNQNLGIASLARVIESTSSYVVELENKKSVLFFLGERNGLSFVSDSPIFSDGSAIVNVEVIGSETEQKLVYRETSLSSFLFTSVQQEITWEYEVVLSEGLRDLSFIFLSWDNLAHVIEAKLPDSNVGKEPTWNQSHEPKTRQVLPVTIKLEFYDKADKMNELYIDLPENSYRTLVTYLREEG